MLSMITLAALPRDEFLVDTFNYPSKPSRQDQARIQWLEGEISQATAEFQHDPEWYVNEWETLTGMDIPDQYTDHLPLQVESILLKGKGYRRTNQMRVSFLPVADQLGNPVVYPEDRLVEDFLPVKVYVLKDTLYKQLAVA